MFYMLFIISVIIFSHLILHSARGDQSPGPGPEWIVFESDRDGNQEIYLTGPRGEQTLRLTQNSYTDTAPRLSPDKKRIVFESDRDGNKEIYLMMRNGTGQTRLTNSSSGDWSPAWSPDGNRIVFCSDRAGAANLYTLESNSTNLKQLTRYQDEGARFGPVYSPEGDRLALTQKSKPGRRWRSVILDLKDLSVWKFCGGLGNCRPAWSPDGKTIALVKHVDRPNTEIYLFHVASGELTRLTHNPAKDYFPVFSPDGKKILFSSQRDTGRWQLYLYDLTQGTVRRFLKSPGNDRLSDWR